MMDARTKPTPVFAAERVVADMAKRGWNASQLASRAHLSPATVNLFLSGERQTAKTAARIASALGYSVRRYFAGIEMSAA